MDKSIAGATPAVCKIIEEKIMYIKKVVVEDKEITLMHNALTYILYKNYTGRDLLADTMDLGINLKGDVDIDGKKINVDELAKKAQKDINSLSNEELSKIIDITLNAKSSEYILYLTAALIATAIYPQKKAFEDIIAELPDDIMYDAEFMKEITNFITINIDRVKKKIVAVK